MGVGRGWKMRGGGVQEGRREFAKDVYKEKKKRTPCWPPVVFVTIQQLDVDRLQMRIAIATLSWLLIQSQDCGPHVRTQTIQ